MTRTVSDRLAADDAMGRRTASAAAAPAGGCFDPVSRPAQSASLHEAVVDCWGFDIVSGAIPAGTTTTADALADRLGVSRAVVREAARSLEYMGLLATRRRVGMTVLPPSCWKSLDHSVIRWRLTGPDGIRFGIQLIEIQRAVEPIAARLAAHRATPTQCADLAAAAIGIAVAARAADLTSQASHIARFHRELLAASGNDAFRGFVAVADLIERHAPTVVYGQEMPDDWIRLYAAAAAAIQAKDPDAAGAALTDLRAGSRSSPGPHDNIRLNGTGATEWPMKN